MSSQNTSVYDRDLNPVLEKASNEDLEPFIELLTKTSTNQLDNQNAYKANYPDHSKYTDLAAKDFREFGGNTFVNIFREGGPSYHEILCDVADKVKAPYLKDYSVDRIEDSIVEKIMRDSIDKMSEEERKALAKEVMPKYYDKPTKEAMIAVSIALFRAGGFRSYQMLLIIVNAVWKALVGHGLRIGGNALLVRLAGILSGPVGWIITGIWTAIDVAGPAYRVTIPGVLYVAMLRKKMFTPTCPHCKEMIPANVKFCPECGHSL